MGKTESPQRYGRSGSPSGAPLLELWLSAKPEAVADARRRAISTCEKAGASDEDCLALDLALGEALANAVTHGAPPDGDRTPPDRQIHICVWEYSSRIIVQVHDHGPGFDPPLPPYRMPSPSAGRVHGRGLPLMQTLTDALLICRSDTDEGGSSIYLIKGLKDPKFHTANAGESPTRGGA